MEDNKKNATATKENEIPVVDTKTKRKLHFQNPFKIEKVEVPVKAKKEKPAKEPKAEKTGKSGFAKGFMAGYMAGAATTAGAGILGSRMRKCSADDVPDESDQIEDELPAEDSEDSDEEPSEE